MTIDYKNQWYSYVYMKIYYRLDRIIMVRLINCKLKGIDILVYTCEIIDCESVANI